MVILGSRYFEITRLLREKLGHSHEVRDLDPSRPLVDQIKDVHVLILGGSTVGRDVVAAAEQLLLIQQHGRGIGRINMRAVQRRNIAVTIAPGYNAVSTAELTITLMFQLAKRLFETDVALEAGLIGTPVGNEIAGSTMAIIGLGRVGREVAKMARGLGMRVIAARRVPQAQDEELVEIITGPSGVPNLLPEADYVVLTLDPGPLTTAFFGKELLSVMKPGAFLINTARADLVVYDDLLASLRDGRLAGAAFDVFWNEPADPCDPILSLPNFILTPHIGGFTRQCNERTCDLIAENIRRLESDEQLLHSVNDFSKDVTKYAPIDRRLSDMMPALKPEDV